MLNKLFGPKWKHRNAQIRKSALESLNPAKTEHQEIYTQVLKTETDAGIRRLLVGRLLDTGLLQDLIRQDESLQNEAQKRLRMLLGGKTQPVLPLEHRLAILEQMGESELLEYLCKNAVETQIRSHALERIDRQSLFGDRALNDPDPQLRLKALSCISQLSTLERVYKNSRRKDKKVASKARERIDQIKAETQRPLELGAEAKQMVAELQALVNHGVKTGKWSDVQKQVEQMQISWDKLQSQWQELGAEPDRTADKSYAELVQQFQAGYQQQMQQQRLEREQEERNQPHKAAQRKVCESLSERLDAMESVHFSEQFLLESKQFLEQAVAIWGQAEEALKAELAEIDTDLLAHYSDLLRKYQQQLGEINLFVSWQDALQQLHQQVQALKKKNVLESSQLGALAKKYKALKKPKPDRRHELEGRIQEELVFLEQRLAEQQAEQDKKLSQFKDQVLQMQTYLDKGQSIDAVGISSKIRKTLTSLASAKQSQLRKSAEWSRYQSALAELEELQSWRSWSNTPVKKSLFDQMCELEREIAPFLGKRDYNWADVAARIREARLQWKNLSKAEPSDSRELWEQFDTVCNRLYEPCQVYFDQLAQNREENYKRREKVCDDLEQFWGTLSHKPLDLVDWKKLDEIIRIAQQEWSGLGFVDRKDKTRINDRFRKILNQLRDFSKSYRRSNTEQKKQIIEQAATLATQLEAGELDLGQAIESVKGLQKQWKEIGLALKDGDLWRRFRHHCDAVFEKREEQKQVKEQQIQEQLDKAAQVCSQLDSLLKRDEQDASVLKQEFASLQKSWKEIKSIKHNSYTRLQRDYGRYQKQLQEQVERLRHKQKRQQLESELQLWRLCTLAEDNFCGSLQNSVDLQSNTAEHIEQQRQLIEAKKTPLWNLLNSRLDHIKNLSNISQEELLQKFSGYSKEEVQQSRRHLCIKMEILAGVESPTADQKERMATQVSQLADKMKQSVSDVDEQLRQLLDDWHQTSALPACLPELEDRFMQAYKALNSI